MTKITNITIDELTVDDSISFDDLNSQFCNSNVVVFSNKKKNTTPVIASITEDGGLKASLSYNNNKWEECFDPLGNQNIYDVIVSVKTVITESENEDQVRIICKILRKDLIHHDESSEKTSKLPCPAVSQSSHSLSMSGPSMSGPSLSIPSTQGPLNSTGINATVPAFDLSQYDGQTRNDILKLSARQWYKTRRYPTKFTNCVINEQIKFNEDSFGKNPIWLNFERRDDLDRNDGIFNKNYEQIKKTREDRLRDDIEKDSNPKDNSRSSSLKFDFQKNEYILSQIPPHVESALYKNVTESLAAQYLYQHHLEEGKLDNAKSKDEQMRDIGQEVKWCYRYMEILKRKKNSDDLWEPSSKLTLNYNNVSHLH